ncbi:MAG: prepilin peptidase [Sciscionella sp.]
MRGTGDDETNTSDLRRSSVGRRDGELAVIASVELFTTWALVGALIATLIGRAARRHEPAVPSWQIPVQILTTAVLFATLAWRLGSSLVLFPPSWLAATGVPLAAIDLRIRRLPDRLVLPSYLAIPGLAALTTLTGTDPTVLVRAALGMVALLAFYGLLYTRFPGQLGGGDVKLAGPIGFLLAWQSWSALLAGTLLTWVLATLAVLLTTVSRLRTGDQSLPLGPFLVGAALVTTLLLPWDLGAVPRP